ncbi:DISARM system phospholipase D-like protein DrmC [Antrihabitans stalactiti]|uniref:phospholipase D n=1 Tax=Antrihabitans stalactiti TaxID=2584121 RepID=A0A848KHR3_9NOCA|nr:endonuclease [Antrihabitans stalactiti]
MNEFERIASAAAPALGVATIRTVAGHLSSGTSDHAVINSVGDRVRQSISRILQARNEADVAPAHAAVFLRGLAAGYEHAASDTVETVWSGPSEYGVPVRATAQVLIEVINTAKTELLLMTYSAKPHEQIRTSLTAATSRGVSVSVVVETIQGAGSAMSGAEPAAAFARIPGLRLWHWPRAQRLEATSKMHAKLAVADRRLLFVSSANLTQSGVEKNVEAGLLVRGGNAPARAAEHVDALRISGILVPLTSGGQ